MNHSNRPEQPPAPQASEVLPRRNFWQTRTAQDALPFCTSLVFHLLIIAMGILLVPKIVRNMTPNHAQVQDAAVDSGLDLTEHFGAMKSPPPDTFPKIEGDPAPTGDLAPLHKGLGKPTIDFPGGSGGNDTLMVIGKGAAAGNGSPFAAGWGDPSGKSFTHGGGQGPVFQHPTKAAKSVVFVCDATGSMLERGKMAILQEELSREIGRMTPVQLVNVIFFQETPDGLGYKAFKPGLVSAKWENQQAVGEFLSEVSAHGPTVPIKALDEAFHQSPQLIYFLTDGEFDNPDGPNDTDMLAYFRAKNAGSKIQINTVLFLRDHQDTNVDAVTKTLKTVAKENGGDFKLIYADDFAGGQ